jgi:hypothetical protein
MDLGDLSRGKKGRREAAKGRDISLTHKRLFPIFYLSKINFLSIIQFNN